MSEEQADLGKFSEVSEAKHMDADTKRVKISEIGKIITGNTPSTKEEGNYGGDIPFIRVSDFSDDIYIGNTEKTLTEKGAGEVKNKELPENAVMVSCIGSGLGKTAMADRKCFTNQQINSVIPSNDYHPWYVYYSLTTEQEKFQNYAGGSAQPILSKTKFGNIEVEVHGDYEMQRKIGNTLRRFDEKKNINENINNCLEEIAQTLYKSYFVDFDPYNEFKQSELGEIPAGFEVKTISEFAHIILGNSPKSEYYNENGEGLPFFQGSKNFGVRYPEVEKWCTKKKKVAKNGDVLISIRAPVGDVNRAMRKSVVGRGVTALRMKEHSNEFLYHLLKANKQNWEKYKSGTTFNSINKTDIQEFPVALPPEEHIEKFNNMVKPMAEKFRKNVKENENLVRLRDTLLPKLMSNEIIVDPDNNNEPTTYG